MSEPIVHVRALSKAYPRQRVDAPFWARAVGRAWGWTGSLDDWPTLNEGLPVLRDVDIDVRGGEILAITGPSGAGKSTLLHLIGALDLPSRGTILYKGEDVTLMSSARLAGWRNRHVGYVFQFYHLFPDLSAEENVLVPAMVAYSVAGYASRRGALRARAAHLLDRVGLGDRRHHHPNQLSGGEQQRVAIARAVAKRPSVLLCDEPTGALDVTTGVLVLQAIERVNRELGTTTAVITHNATIARMADRVISLSGGLIASVHENVMRVAASDLEW